MCKQHFFLSSIFSKIMPNFWRTGTPRILGSPCWSRQSMTSWSRQFFITSSGRQFVTYFRGHYSLPLSFCTRFLGYRFGHLLQTRKKIEFKTNWIFFQFRNWFLFPSYLSSFLSRVKYFGGPCSPIQSLTKLHGCVYYQFPIITQVVFFRL